MSADEILTKWGGNTAPVKTGLGDAFFAEDGDRLLYRSEPSTMPKWYRRVTRDYKRKALPNGVVVAIGWELRPQNRMYTTCTKVQIMHTEWRH